MGFIECIWLSEESIETGLGAEIDRPAAVFEARKIRPIGITKFSSAESDEVRVLLRFGRIQRHILIASGLLPR